MFGKQTNDQKRRKRDHRCEEEVASHFDKWDNSKLYDLQFQSVKEAVNAISGDDNILRKLITEQLDSYKPIQNHWIIRYFETGAVR